MKYLLILILAILSVGCDRTENHQAVLNTYGENVTPINMFDNGRYDLGQCVALIDQYTNNSMRTSTTYKIPYEFRSKDQLMIQTDYTTFVFIFDKGLLVNVWSKNRPNDKNNAETARQIMSNLCFNAFIQQKSLN